MQDVDKKQEQVAVFRYGLIAPALHLPLSERRKYFLGLEGKELDVPYYGRKKYKRKTLSNWLLEYKNGGLDNLRPVIRSDKGISRRMSETTIAAIKLVIEKYPFLSCSGIYRILIKDEKIRSGDFSESTLRSYIRKNDLRKPATETIGRKKYEKENVNELWVCDFMYGPHLRNGKRKSQSYLCAIIDDHSRIITGWGWHFAENCNVLAITLKKAISVYGLPQVFYCDNGSVFVSNYLHLVCAGLGIALVHSQPYDSPSRGKIERFFKTVREKFLAALNTADFSIGQLNECFQQWLDKDYHKARHAGIEECPLDRYFNNASKNKIKTISRHELDNAFLNKIKRRVRNDATVAINKKFYEVPAAYIGKQIELCFPIDNPGEITLRDKNKPVVQIKPVNLVENANKPHTAIHFKDIGGN